MKLKADRSFNKYYKTFAPKQSVMNGIHQEGLVNYVAQNGVAVVSIYCYCKLLQLSQEEFMAARTAQCDRLRRQIETIAEQMK